MTAILAANLSFSFWILISGAHGLAAEGPIRCGRFRASGTLKTAETLVVNEGKQGETTLRLAGRYQKHAKAGLAVEVEGEIRSQIKNFEGEIVVSSLRLVVPDPLGESGDALRLLQEKPCRK